MNQPRRIVFLDFDGVLNSWRFMDARGDAYRPTDLDAEAVKRVEALCQRTGAAVVVSSTWRLLYPLADLRCFLREHGFTGTVISRTPDLRRQDRGVQRGHEIQAWLDNDARGPVESFVILDDDADMAHLDHRLVRTNAATGLLDEHVERAVALLEGAA